MICKYYTYYRGQNNLLYIDNAARDTDTYNRVRKSLYAPNNAGGYFDSRPEELFVSLRKALYAAGIHLPLEYTLSDRRVSNEFPLHVVEP